MTNTLLPGNADEKPKDGTAPSQKMSDLFLGKLQSLYGILENTHLNFCRLLYAVHNLKLREAMISLVHDSRLYASEVSMLMRLISGNEVLEDNDKKLNDEQPGESLNQPELVKNAINRHGLLFAAYNDILNENALVSEVRKMLDHQLAGIRYNFLKLKSLQAFIGAS